MTDDTYTAIEPAKRGRPAGAKARAKRRNFAAELAALEMRVTMAVRVLRKASDADTPAGQQLIAVAIDTLTQAE